MKTSHTPPARAGVSAKLAARLADAGRIRFGAGVGTFGRRRS